MSSSERKILAVPVYILVAVIIVSTIAGFLILRHQTNQQALAWSEAHRQTGRSLIKLEAARHKLVQLQNPDFSEVDHWLGIVGDQREILANLASEGSQNFTKLYVDPHSAIDAGLAYDGAMSRFRAQLLATRAAQYDLVSSLEEQIQRTNLEPGSEENRIEGIFLRETQLTAIELNKMGEKYLAEYDHDSTVSKVEQAYSEYLATSETANTEVHNKMLAFLANLNQFKAATEEIIAAEIRFGEEAVALVQNINRAVSKAHFISSLIFVLAIAEFVTVAGIFLFNTYKLRKELIYQNQELENLISIRTECLDMAMDNLQNSVDKQKQIEEELRLSQRLEAVGQLAAGIAHEINTPSQFVSDNLQFILEAQTDLAKVRDAYAKAVKDMATSPEHQNVLQKLHDLEEEIDLEFLKDELPSALENSLEGMARISKIVKSMKDFSHPGSDGRDLTDINKSIETTLSVARNEWKYAATVKKDFDEDLPKAPVFATELNQVLLNIIVNAAHAIEQKNADTGSEELGTIHIKTDYDDEYVNVHIQDSGCGIPQKNIDRIFDPFFTTKEVGKGTGQGLSIARKIVVDTHGGVLDVSSKPGEYTRFCIRLPRSTSADIAEGTNSDQQEQIAGVEAS